MRIFMSYGNRRQPRISRREISGSPRAIENSVLWNHQLFGVRVMNDINLSGSGNLNGSSPVAADCNNTCPNTGISRE